MIQKICLLVVLFYIFNITSFECFSIHAQKSEKALLLELKELQEATKNYEQVKEELLKAKERNDRVNDFIDSTVVWSNHLQKLAEYTQNRRVWFSSLRTSRRYGVGAPYHSILLDACSASRDLNIPNDYRKDMVFTDWWSENFQPNGINDPAYEIKSLPRQYFAEEFYHIFRLYIDLKPYRKRNQSQKINELKKQIKNQKRKLQEIEDSKIEIKELTQNYFESLKIFPDDKSLERFFSTVRQISDELKIPPFGFKPKIAPEIKGHKHGRGRPSPYAEDLMMVEIPLSFQGTYDQIGQFINRIESFNHLVSIQYLRIDSLINKKNVETMIKEMEKDSRQEKQILKVTMFLRTFINNNKKADIDSTTEISLSEPLSMQGKHKFRPPVSPWKPSATKSLFKIKLQLKEKPLPEILNDAKEHFATMEKLFSEEKYQNCLSRYKDLVTFLKNRGFEPPIKDATLQLLLDKARALKERARIRLEFASLPLKITSIIWIENNPLESSIVVNGEAKKIDDYLDYSARILSISKNKVEFSYRGEKITKSISK